MCFQRPDADLQYLSLVAASAVEKEPETVLLLVSPTDVQNARNGQAGVFLLAGPAGEAPADTLACISAVMP